MEIELRNICKHYGSVRANESINLRVQSGTIHGILGENGAGKSTLMKILAGYAAKTSGTILLDGQRVEYHSPAAATRLGIGMLYQDPLDFPSLTVIDNFSLGQLTGLGLNRRRVVSTLGELAQRFGFDLDFAAPLDQFTIGERQQLELLRLLALQVRLLILDEPTTGISSIQKAKLFSALRRLAKEGMTVLLVSHKLEDIETLCDRITVLRGGRVSGEMDRPFQVDRLLGLMFGQLPPPARRRPAEPGEVLLVSDRVSAQGGRAGLKPCSFTVRRGEMIGLAGLEGSGQGLLLRLAAGLIKPATGSLRLGDHVLPAGDHCAFLEAGIFFMPAARLEEGLVRGLTITEHCALAALPPSWTVPWPRAREEASRRIEHFRIRGEPSSPVESLSGGNQQRLLLSMLPAEPRLLLLEQPTRGLDLESARWVWSFLQDLCSRGTAILFSSAELDEIMAVADRVMVFFDGALVRDVAARESDMEGLARAIAGK